jgi:subtilisin family serine protease
MEISARALRVALIVALTSTCSAAVVAAQRVDAARTQFVVQLRSDVDLSSFVADYAPDERTANPRANYHSHAVVGAVMALERQYGFRSYAFFSRALRGFAARLTPQQRDRLAANPLVAAIEPDTPATLEPVVAAPMQIVDWGIGRVSADISSTRSGDGVGAVTGVNVYVIDTGVDPTHPDINLVNHVTFAGEPNADCNGHGTGVAGIIAAKDNSEYTVGVAPGAPVTGVKVFSCEGVTLPSLIVQGVDWVTANAVKPAVVNMSLGSLIPLTAVTTAVLNSEATGIFYAVAAGNGNPFTGQAVSACTSSPANAGYNWFGIPNGIVTVAATDPVDEEASFSNYGPCVNLWAPGVDVTAPWLVSEGGLITASGTSFASPYVAGGAALLLSRVPTLSPPVVEYVLLVTADLTGTTSKDGAAIRRLNVRYF